MGLIDVIAEVCGHHEFLKPAYPPMPVEHLHKRYEAYLFILRARAHELVQIDAIVLSIM